MFTISGAVRDRLARWNGVTAEVLHPPPPQRDYRCDGYGDYLFVASRLTPLKRVDLVLQALAQPEAAGSPMRHRRRRRRAATARASWRGSWVSTTASRFAGRLDEADLVDHLARCRAVVFVPHDEDYGFVTVEAFAAGKAGHHLPRTAAGRSNSCAPGENGWIVAADAASLARAMRRGDGCARARRTPGPRRASATSRRSPGPDVVRRLGDRVARVRTDRGFVSYRTPLETRLAKKVTRPLSNTA